MPRRKKIQLGSLVEVEWEDAWSDDEATTELGQAPEHRPYNITLTGYLVFSDADGVMVAREKLADGRYRSVQYLPKEMVRDIRG